jgi:DNA-binding XRE family transcriptional regulator
METNNHKIVDYDAVLDAKFGAEGSEQRAIAEEMAYAFYTGKIILDARREAKMTQSELAKRANVTKSYISRVENGIITPTVSMFYRIIEALGMRIEIVKTIG